MPPSTPNSNTLFAAGADSAHPGDGVAPLRRRERQRSWLREFLVAPFKDVDDRVRVAR